MQVVQFVQQFVKVISDINTVSTFTNIAAGDIGGGGLDEDGIIGTPRVGQARGDGSRI